MENELAKRLDNWRRTVMGSTGGASGYCASWAKWYVSLHVKERTEAEPKEAREQGALPEIIGVDVQDGWVVESCVRQLDNEAEREVLRCSYVFRLPDHWIRHRLLMRKSHVNLLRQRALTKLTNLLDQVQQSANIPTNNFHAGNVPRQKTTVAHVGAASSSENDEASID